MSSLLARLRPHASLAFSLGGIFMSPSSPISTITAATRDLTKTKYVLRTPRDTASLQREVPTPLVFVSASALDEESTKGMEGFASMFAERGYTCLEIDLAQPTQTPSTSQALMKHYESELRSHIRLMTIPFAPVFIGRAGGALIAQSFVESNPASGLVLIAPPESNAAVTAPSNGDATQPAQSASRSGALALLPTALPEFTFEPLFPLAIVGTPPQLAVLRAQHRLFKPAPPPAPTRNRLLSSITGRGGRGRWDVDSVEVGALDGHEAFVAIERWLDNVGV